MGSLYANASKVLDERWDTNVFNRTGSEEEFPHKSYTVSIYINICHAVAELLHLSHQPSEFSFKLSCLKRNKLFLDMETIKLPTGVNQQINFIYLKKSAMRLLKGSNLFTFVGVFLHKALYLLTVHCFLIKGQSGFISSRAAY